MRENELVEKIKILKGIKPGEDWILSCRARLAFRMEMDRKKNLLKGDVFTLKELFTFWGSCQSNSALRLAQGLIIAIAVVFGGGAVTTLAAMQSLPGSPFYPVKLAIEKIRVFVSLSDESRLQLQTEIADKRLQELNDVIGSQDSTEQKAEKVAQVVDSIQYQMTTVNSQFPKAGAKTESQKTLVAAKIVSEKAGQVSKALTTVKEGLPSDNSDVKTKMTDAIEIADKTNITALEAMIANWNIASATTTKEEIAVKLSEEIKKTEDQIIAKEQKFAQQNSIADKLPKLSSALPIRAVLINQFEQGRELLSKAKEALKNEDFRGALEMIKAAMDINSGAEKITQNAAVSEVKGVASSTEENLAK